VKSIGKLETKMKNKKNNTESNQVRYFIFSKQLSCKDFALCQRKHWGIESFHHVLDNSFMEDRMRMKKRLKHIELEPS
jgi:Transposase DDE domain.